MSCNIYRADIWSDAETGSDICNRGIASGQFRHEKEDRRQFQRHEWIYDIVSERIEVKLGESYVHGDGNAHGEFHFSDFEWYAEGNGRDCGWDWQW